MENLCSVNQREIQLRNRIERVAEIETEPEVRLLSHSPIGIVILLRNAKNINIS